MYAFVHDKNLTRSRITGYRIKSNPFFIALTCEWFFLYFCLNQMMRQNKLRGKPVSAVDMHCDGLGIFTN